MENLPISNSKTSTSWPQSSLISREQAASAIRPFGEEYRDQIFLKYSTPQCLSDAVAAKANSFHDCTNFFGERATLFWLRFHIAETFVFLGIYEKASAYQVRETAEMILRHEIFGQLTFAEFLCFLQKFKIGEYGKIYNSNRPNPQEFLACLWSFWNDLARARGAQEEKDLQEKISRDRNTPGVSWDEYCRLRGIEGRESPLSRFSKQ